MRIVSGFLALLAAAPAVAQPASPDADHVYELNEVEVLPRAQNAADFLAALRDGYPAHLRVSRVEGTVQVAFVVGPDGVPHSARVAESTEMGFDSVTVAAVGVLRFTPATVAGRPISVRVVQPVQWRLPPPEPAASTCDADFCGMRADSADAARAAGGVHELADVEELPRLLNGLAFQRALAQEYPFAPDHPPVGATVEVRFRVEADGTISMPRVTRSSDVRFNDPTMRVIRMLRFRPARVNGRPVKVWVEQPIQWVSPPRPAIPPARRP